MALAFFNWLLTLFQLLGLVYLLHEAESTWNQLGLVCQLQSQKILPHRSTQKVDFWNSKSTFGVDFSQKSQVGSKKST